MNRRVDSKSSSSAGWGWAWLSDFSPFRLIPWSRNHYKVAVASWFRLMQEPLQTALTLGVIAIALALPTLLMQLAAMGGSAIEDMDASSDINLYFSLDASDTAIENYITQWQGDSRIDSLELITSDQGLIEFEQFSGLGDILSNFGENPLPAVLRVLPEQRLYGQSAELRLLIQALESDSIVDTAVLDFGWLDRLQAIVDFFDGLSITVGLLLAVGILLILGNTIRLTIENRRDEIIVIKLVGGTDRFVQRPLLYAGFWYGLLGGLGAIILVGVIGAILAVPLQRILTSYQAVVHDLPGLSFGLFIKLLFLGAFLGCLGAWISVMQHLRKVEPS